MSRFSARLPEVEEKRCFVLGNGPSLKEEIDKKYQKFVDTDLFCVNHFSCTEEYKKFKPKHYVLLDPGFFPAKTEPLSPKVSETIGHLIKDTDWEMNLFLPVSVRYSKHIKEITNLNPNVKICYFNYTILQGFKWFTHFFFRLNIGMPQCQNVTLVCLFLAINLGYKEIYLLGSEQSWFRSIEVDDKNELFSISNHFYSDNSKVEKGSLRFAFPTIADFFMAVVKTFKGYHVIESYAKSRGSKIYNATEGSFVDAFERKRI